MRGAPAPAAKSASSYRLQPAGPLEFRYTHEAAHEVEDLEKPTYTSRIEARNWCSDKTKIEIQEHVLIMMKLVGKASHVQKPMNTLTGINKRVTNMNK